MHPVWLGGSQRARVLIQETKHFVLTIHGKVPPHDPKHVFARHRRNEIQISLRWPPRGLFGVSPPSVSRCSTRPEKSRRTPRTSPCAQSAHCRSPYAQRLRAPAQTPRTESHTAPQSTRRSC